MKKKHTLTLLVGLLLASSLALSSCNQSKNPSDETVGDTTAADTQTVTTPSAPETDDADTTTEAPDKDTTAPDTTPSTDPAESETDEPTDVRQLTAEEAKALLAAAIEADKDQTDGSATIRTLINGEVVSTDTHLVKGEDFVYSGVGEGSTETVIVVGDTAYYLYAYDDGEFSDEVTFVVPALTDKQKEELRSVYLGESAEEDDALYEGLLASTWNGSRNPDGTVSLSSDEPDESLIALLMGDDMDGAELAFGFTLSSEGLLTAMRFTITIPAAITGDEDYVVSSEAVYDPAEPAVDAPADLSAYVEATYEEVFYGAPGIDSEEAAALGLPLNGDHYVIGGADSPYDPEAQYLFLSDYGAYYVDKTFTLYGYLVIDDWGDTYLSISDHYEFWTIFPDHVTIPANGDYVKMTVTHAGYGMIVTAVEPAEVPPAASEGNIMYVTAAALNVRSAPDSSIEDNKVGMLYSGNQVEVLETGLGADGLWCKIAFDCDEGYGFVKITYLSETEPET